MNTKFLFAFFILLQSCMTLVQAYEPSAGLQTLLGRDDASTGTVNESEFGCVYRNANSTAAGEGDWVIDDCDYVGAHYACYNGSQWHVAQALGTVVEPGEPQDGDTSSDPKIKSVDLWDPIKADGVCKNYFGPSYFFSVPVDEDEDLALGVAIADIVAAKKRTWIYYYSNDGIPTDENYWLGNRSKYTNWLDNNPDNTSDDGVADCILLNRDTGYWQDESCSAEHAFACFESGDWLLSKTAGQWRDGFATCQTDYSDTSIYAVPRDSSENDELLDTVLSAPVDADADIDFNQVWLNQTDLAYEEFFISNQTRQSWWAEGQPSNQNNADCTLINSTGDWISESCDLYQAYHACYIGDSSNVGQWLLTNTLTDVNGKAISSYGFGYCKRLADNAEYRAPDSASSNTILADLISAQLGDDAYVWLNFSDQDSEGAWKAETAYQDFESSTSVSDDNNDCVYYSSQTNDEGNWVADQCYAGGATRGFSCTNGYEWKVASQNTNGDSLESDLWKDGFDACEAAFGADYYFAAPSSADDNSRLGLALLLKDETTVWINVNDATNEGVWVANGPTVNLAPVLTLPTNLTHSEQVAIDLTVGAIDPESEGIASYAWSIIDTRIGEDDTGLDTVIEPTLTGETTTDLTISATTLLNDTYYIDLQLEVTDGALVDPATTTALITLVIIPPLKAAYDFNDYNAPELDWTGNGHDLIIDTGEVRITDETSDGTDYYAKMDENDLFEIDGSVDGLQVGSATDDQYTIVYRFKLDEFDTSNNLSNFLMKGTTTEQQPAIFVGNLNEAFSYNTAIGTSDNIDLDGKENLRLGQWVTGAFVKTPTEILTYIDKVEEKLDDPTSPEDLTTVPDASLTKSGTPRYNNESWKFGNANGESTLPLGFAGGIDDIRIYDRALTVDELKTLFPDQPRGRFEFTESTQETEEDATSGDSFTLSVEVDRIEGDDEAVSVGYVLKSGSAILNTDFKLSGTDADSIAGIGYLNWGVHDRDPKTLTVEVLGDDIREGTESFTIELEAQPGEPEITDNYIISIDVLDKTPDPYGNVAFAGINESIIEGESGSITVERSGDDTLGAVDVWYTVTENTATSPEYFSISNGDFPITGTDTGVVVGEGILTFTANSTGTAVGSQTQTIDFSTVDVSAYEATTTFTVTLDDITDVGSTVLSDPDNSAILGTNTIYVQTITDASHGRISFKQADYGSIDEDSTSVNRSVILVLERIEGTRGAICVDFTFSGAGIESSDYTFNSQDRTGDNDDVYWLDGDDSDKIIVITALDDQTYEELETLTIAWQEKTSCDYDDTAGNDAVVTPEAAITGDNAAAILDISDQTDDIVLAFGSSLYTTTEEGSPTLTVTVTATASNTPFSVYLQRDTATATAYEVDHYGDLSSKEQLIFPAGETEIEIEIPIVDNCDSADSLSFGMSLSKLAADLTTPNSDGLNDIIDVSSSSTEVFISNFSAAPAVAFSNHYEGITDDALRADWNGDIRVTSEISSDQRSPKATQMGVQADITHACYDNLQYTWVNSIDTLPALPVVTGLLSFSEMPTISGYDEVDGADGGSILSDLFSLPFIIQDTVLSFELEIYDPENGMTYTSTTIPELASTITMKQYFHQIDNNDEDQCFENQGMGDDLDDSGCDNNADNQLAYNFETKQLVWNDDSVVSCVDANTDDNLTTEVCNSSDEQKWTILDSTNEDGIQRYGNSNYRVCELAGSNKQQLTNDYCSAGADNYSWSQFD